MMDGYTHIHYDYRGFFNSDIEDNNFHFYLEVPLNLDVTHADKSFPAAIKDAKINLIFKVYWNSNRTVDVGAAFALRSAAAHKGPIDIP